jgi:hypothetical protein
MIELLVDAATPRPQNIATDNCNWLYRLSCRARKGLMVLGVSRPAQLNAISLTRLSRVKNIGRCSVKEIRQLAAQYGIAMRDICPCRQAGCTAMESRQGDGFCLDHRSALTVR